MAKSTRGPRKKPAAERTKPVREKPRSKATLDEFEQEGMGVAAKE
jgi:hypothetical protein